MTHPAPCLFDKIDSFFESVETLVVNAVKNIVAIEDPSKPARAYDRRERSGGSAPNFASLQNDASLSKQAVSMPTLAKSCNIDIVLRDVDDFIANLECMKQNALVNGD
jgi:hypothetical protein